jgi:diacylglycerol kinase (ATP)
MLARQAEEGFRAAGAEALRIHTSSSIADLAAATIAASERGAVPVVFGGDGSLRSAVQALAERARFGMIESPIGFLPAGTGNDVMRGLGAHEFARALDGLIRAWKEGSARALDAALLHVPGGPAAGTHVVLVIWGLGLTAEAARSGVRLRRLGRAAYAIGGFGGLLTHRPFEGRITVDGREREVCLDMLAVSNCPYTGGGMNIAPGLRLDDGRMQLLTVRIPGNPRLFFSMTSIFRGSHGRRRGVDVSYIKEIKVVAAKPLPMNLDGDVIDAREARLTLQPAFFRVMLAPAATGIARNSLVGPGSAILRPPS